MIDGLPDGRYALVFKVEMWNSNSVTSWLLEQSPFDTTQLAPPASAGPRLACRPRGGPTCADPVEGTERHPAQRHATERLRARHVIDARPSGPHPVTGDRSRGRQRQRRDLEAEELAARSSVGSGVPSESAVAGDGQPGERPVPGDLPAEAVPAPGPRCVRVAPALEADRSDCCGVVDRETDDDRRRSEVVVSTDVVVVVGGPGDSVAGKQGRGDPDRFRPATASRARRDVGTCAVGDVEVAEQLPMHLADATEVAVVAGDDASGPR